jgi:predicted Zn-dependent protease
MRHVRRPALAGFLFASSLVFGAQQELPEPVRNAFAAAQARFANPTNRFEYPVIARDLAQMLEAAPDAQEVRLLRIDALLKSGDRRTASEEMKRVAAARDSLSEAGKIELRILAAHLGGKPQEEIRFLTELLDLRPDDRWLHYELARAYSDLDRYGDAVRHIELAFLRTGPEASWEASWIHALHSKALLRSGADPRAAVHAANAGRAETTSWPQTLYRLALAQYAAGDAIGGNRSLNEWVTWVREAGRVREADVQVSLGLFFYELKDYKQAEQHFRDSLAFDRESVRGMWALGYLLIEKPGGLAEGSSLIDRGLEKAPNDANLLDARGWALYRANRAAEGYSWLRRAQLALHGAYSQRVADHLAAVAAELKDSGAPPAPHTPWL